MNARTNERTHDMTPQFQEIEIASRSPPGPSLGRLSETRGGVVESVCDLFCVFFLFCLFFIFCFLLISVDFYWSSLIFIDVLWFPLIFLIFVDFFWFSCIFFDFRCFSFIFVDCSLIVVDCCFFWFSLKWWMSGGKVVGRWEWKRYEDFFIGGQRPENECCAFLILGLFGPALCWFSMHAWHGLSPLYAPSLVSKYSGLPRGHPGLRT